MTAMILPRSKEPVLVVAEQAHDLRIARLPKRKNGIHATFGVRASIDVVAQEDHGIAGATLVLNLVKNVLEGRKIAVDVTDREGGHAGSRRVNNLVDFHSDFAIRSPNQKLRPSSATT
jgi:hypothetical protein